MPLIIYDFKLIIVIAKVGTTINETRGGNLFRFNSIEPLMIEIISPFFCDL